MKALKDFTIAQEPYLIDIKAGDDVLELFKAHGVPDSRAADYIKNLTSEGVLAPAKTKKKGD